MVSDIAQLVSYRMLNVGRGESWNHRLIVLRCSRTQCAVSRGWAFAQNNIACIAFAAPSDGSVEVRKRKNNRVAASGGYRLWHLYLLHEMVSGLIFETISRSQGSINERLCSRDSLLQEARNQRVGVIGTGVV